THVGDGFTSGGRPAEIGRGPMAYHKGSYRTILFEAGKWRRRNPDIVDGCVQYFGVRNARFKLFHGVPGLEDGVNHRGLPDPGDEEVVYICGTSVSYNNNVHRLFGTAATASFSIGFRVRWLDELHTTSSDWTLSNINALGCMRYQATTETQLTVKRFQSM